MALWRCLVRLRKESACICLDSIHSESCQLKRFMFGEATKILHNKNSTVFSGILFVYEGNQAFHSAWLRYIKPGFISKIWPFLMLVSTVNYNSKAETWGRVPLQSCHLRQVNLNEAGYLNTQTSNLIAQQKLRLPDTVRGLNFNTPTWLTENLTSNKIQFLLSYLHQLLDVLCVLPG